MKTADEARAVSLESLPEDKKNHLVEGVEAIILAAAKEGNAHCAIEEKNFSDVERHFIRKLLKQHGYEVSEVGLTIYW